MPCSHLRFLVVEDHPVQRRVAALLLKNLGAEAVHLAENGQAALDILRQPGTPVDIVLSDVSMPGMDGAELVRQLAAASSDVALILNSALSPAQLSEIAHMSRAYQINLLGAVGKPVSAVKLVPLVQRYRAMKARALGEAFSLADIALGFEQQQFEAFYEPRAELASAQVVGWHAVPHWRHPQRGVLAPAAFMESVDGCGLHDDMVWAVLSQGVGACRGWREQGLELDLSVSLSLASLAEAGLVERLVALLADAGLAPGCLVLGVSAAGVEPDRARALAQLARLRRAGFRLGVEDYGTGTNWSPWLAQVPFTHLKISRNLVAGLRGDPTGRAGLVVALDAAQQHRLASVARGVATLDDWNLLQGWGCNFAQGRLVGEPIPANQVPAWLAERSRRARAVSATGNPLDLGLPGEGDGDAIGKGTWPQ